MTNLTHNSFFCMFISLLCMFRATSCSSSGESIVSIQHLVCVTLCRWPCSVQVDLHTRRSPTQSDTYQMLYWCSWFSWWWARGHSKHVENLNKHIEKELCVKFVIYKNYTEMHGRQNIKYLLVRKKFPEFNITQEITHTSVRAWQLSQSWIRQASPRCPILFL
jgi:hypothetical protein